MSAWPGTAEQRERRLAQKLGRCFIGFWRSNVLGKGWFKIVVERTPLRDKWVWSRRYRDEERDGELERIRTEIAGEAVLAAFADGSQSRVSTTWFAKAAEQDDHAEAWLVDPERLELDGWVRTGGEDANGKWSGWRKGARD